MEQPPPPPPPSTAAEKDKVKQIQLKKVSKISPQQLKLQTHSPYVVDKVPTADSSPFLKAKRVLLIDKERSKKTTSLFRSAVKSILKQENPPTSHKIQERAKAQEELKRSIMEYKQFLKSCDFINSNSQWRKVQDKLEGDERCSRLEKIDQLEIFQEYIRELEKEEHRKIQKEEIRRVEHKNRDEFRKLMETHVADGVLTARMHWRDYCIKVKDLPAYLAVSSNTSGSSPKDLFEDVAEELEKQLINREPCEGISLFKSAINLVLKQEEVGVKRPSIDGALKTQPSSPVKYEIYSFYEQAKQAEELSDLENAVSLYYSAIKFDRCDDALKDLAFVLQRMGHTKEAIDLIEKHQDLIEQHQDSLDVLLLSLYKGSGRIDEYIELLQHKLKLVEEGSAFGGKRTKIARSQERKCHGSIKQDRSRLLGNLAWAYMQQEDYHNAKPLYREALFIEPDKNKQCNLAICLMNSGSISEAKNLLQAVTPSSEERKLNAPYIKVYDSALKTLSKLENCDSIEEHL